MNHILEELDRKLSELTELREDFAQRAKSGNCSSGECPAGECPAGKRASGECPGECLAEKSPAGECPAGKHASGECPEGRLRIANRGNFVQYYRVVPGGKPNGTFIANRQIKTAKALAQKDYDRQVLEAICNNIRLMEKFRKALLQNDISRIYAKLHPARQALIKPAVTTDNEFAAAWQSKPFTPKDMDFGSFTTAKGERVRSKSENLIADTLYRLDVPYRYEAPVKIKGWGKVYPDFTCLNKRTRQEFIWEHFGMMDDPDYARRAVSKIQKYAQNGYTIGNNLLATFESNETPLSSEHVMRVAQAALF